MIQFKKGNPIIFGDILFDSEHRSSENNKQEILNKLMSMLVSKKLINKKSEELKIRLCLDEVITNAIIHGNNINPVSKFRVKLFADDIRWGIEVQDEGQGFNFDNLPDYEDTTFLATSSRGRGLLILQEIIDDVIYYGNGNKVVLIQRISKGIDVD